MPSAEKSTPGATKLESAPLSEPKSAENPQNENAQTGANSSIAQVVSIISNKVRNLEKRKNKLDGYIKEEEGGKELSSEQQKAVSKYDEVTQQLNLSKEFYKQFQAIATAASKDAKREAKKLMFTRQNQETTKVRDVMMIQDLLQRLRADQVRNDFLNHRNGACPVDKAEMEFIDKFAQHVLPTRPSFSNQPSFEAASRTSAEHFSNLIDGRNRSFLDTGMTYEKAKELFTRIQTCGYWEKDVKVVEEVAPAPVEESRKETETPSSDDLEAKEGPVEVVEKARAIPHALAAPAPTQVPTPTFNGNVNMMPIPQQQVQQQQMMARMAPQQIAKPLPETPTNVPLSMKHTVTAVENAYFSHMKFAQPHQGQMLAANGMPIVTNDFGGGHFSFLQDSEIDTPAPGSQQQQKMPVKQQSPPSQQQLSANPSFKNANANFHPQSPITTAGQMYPPGLKVQQQPQQQQMPNSVSHIPVNYQASPQQQPNTVSSSQVPSHLIPNKQQPQQQPANANRINQMSPFGAQTPPMTQQQQATRPQAAYPMMPSTQQYQQQPQQPSQNLQNDQKQVATPKMDGSGDAGHKSSHERGSHREEKQRDEYQQQPHIDTWTNETATQAGGNGNFSSRSSGGNFNANSRSSGGAGGGSKYNNYNRSNQPPKRNYNENGSGDSPRDGSSNAGGSGTFFRNNERFNGNTPPQSGGRFEGRGGGNYKSREGNFRAGSGRFVGSASSQGSSNPSQRK